jgi:hypothetical protein
VWENHNIKCESLTIDGGSVVENEPGAFEQAVKYMRDHIRREVAAGFYPADGIAASAVEVASDEGIDPGLLEPLAEQFTQEAFAEHYRDQAAWPDRTDCDRLDEAFAELETRGIVCRQNFSCCGNCGSGEIWGEMRQVEESGHPVRGYAFYHMQDTESGVECGHLYLGYGAKDEGEHAALAVAQEIIEVLSAHGLTTNWNGSWRQRIGVTIDWKRRRPLIAGFVCRKPQR